MPEKSNTALPRREFIGRVSAASAVVACGSTALASHSSLSAPKLQRHVGEVFQLAAEEGMVRVKLASADAAPRDAGRPSHVRQDPFSLIFKAPRGTVFKDQICRIQHPELGTIEAYVSPVDPAERSVNLQVVFA